MSSGKPQSVSSPSQGEPPELPQDPSVWPESLSRRRFLELSAASIALAGASGCTRQPLETIVPYVDPPEALVPGKPVHYASTSLFRGVATGILVESHMGRPTKVEGSPEHPAGTGATDIFAQASVLDLYDPDRSQVVVNAGRITTWDDFLAHVTPAIERQRQSGGRGLRVLTRTTSSPSLASRIRETLSAFPEARWHVFESVPRDTVWQGTTRAFGERLEPRYRFEEADVIVSLDADFLSPGAGQLADTRGFTSRRDPAHPRGMNRLYVVEPLPSLAGAMADHRLAVPDRGVTAFARALARELGLEVGASGAQAPEPLGSWARAVAADLREHRRRGLVLAGEQQPAVVHALAHAMNTRLENDGTVVEYIRPLAELPEGYSSALASLQDLAAAMNDGAVELLLMLEANPVYDAPADIGFSEAVGQVPLRVHLGLYEDETAALSHWHIPAAHPLESWGDARASDGTVSFNQPLIAPLYDGKTPHELLSVFLDGSGRTTYEILRSYWRGARSSAADGDDEEFESFWRRTVHDGFVVDTAFSAVMVSLRPDTATFGEARDDAETGDSLELLFRPDPSIFDGRFANNGWLQELPKPFTKLTWDNALLLAPRTARRLELENEELVDVTLDGRRLRAPVWTLEGMAENVACLHLGHGRTRAGRVGDGAGVDANQLRASTTLWRGTGVAVTKAGGSRSLASTQSHFDMEGRRLVREATRERYESDPGFATTEDQAPRPEETLYPVQSPSPPADYAWGMSINLGACTGCNACVVACQAENNIPVVGREQVRVGRELHWIRVDHYVEGEPEGPRLHHQPVPCMHCENAPCEVVCPVEATQHTPEGLNAMIYNRCVGTRYCSNNCPYKVRRFNFLNYSDVGAPVLSLQKNPDVSVRSRGVMEKCTYCVQRINAARIEAEKADRRITDGEVATACQQVCPADAIVFGDVQDPESRVSREKANPRDYTLLAELGTRPRTSYTAKVRNPNPLLKENG